MVCLAVLCRGGQCLEGKDLALAVFVPLMSSMQVFPQDGFELSLRAGRGPELLVQPPGFTEGGADEQLQGHDLLQVMGAEPACHGAEISELGADLEVKDACP